MATHFRTLKVADVRRETTECVSVLFAVPDELREEFRFQQGQNITVRMTVAGEEVRRSYSICSSPLDHELRIAIKKVPGGIFSTWANEQLAIGDTLEVLPPSGRFNTELHPGNRKLYLAFAAGSGITPVISLIKTTLAVEPASRFTLVYGNRHRLSIIFREELEALKNRYMDRLAIHHMLSREELDIPLYQGRIDAAKCDELCPRLIDLRFVDEVFLCGPEEMIFSVKGWLEAKGMERRKIHFELFHTLDAAGVVRRGLVEEGLPLKDELVQPGHAMSQVTVRLDGISHSFELPFHGASVLEAALMEGVDLPFACKGGVCSTCRAKLLEGKVEMDLNYALEADELEAGFVLTCQSHPRSPKIIVDFDSK
ncbi:MAG TPA: 1,2-phenylacetyl-CoA epoxidase subunit PaaE [Puia sp.]|nr:1,2-phenylacetyl-CoA epoxidase subunit PaaE [Puia sp.]